MVLAAVGGLAVARSATLNPEAYLPAIFRYRPPTKVFLPTVYRLKPPPPPTPTPTPQPNDEVRGLWVSRFDWTIYGQPASPAKIDEIVANAAYAGFNVIFFQVRGAADAYYAPGLEPWAQRVTGGQLGQAPNPWWDPLAHFVNAAHGRGIQLHAYLNVYPVWDSCVNPPPHTTPEHFYYVLEAGEGTTAGKLNGLQWDTSYNTHCSGYLRATPASYVGDGQYVALANDLMTRYAIDGIHLDHIRYGGANTSCDPVSQYYYGWQSCPDPRTNATYASWQRQQINGTVSKFYQAMVAKKPALWLSAAVWPIYQTKPEWGWSSVSQGYYDYYQDSKAWVQGGYVDSIMPMIYPANYGGCPYEGFWTLAVWQTLVADFQSSSSGRWVIPGIGAGYCSFDEIANRIAAARAIGTAGHAIFSYSGLAAGGYFDDLANGPYAEPAAVPPRSWTH